MKSEGKGKKGTIPAKMVELCLSKKNSDKYLRHFIFHSVIVATMSYKFFEHEKEKKKKENNDPNLACFSLRIIQELRSDCIHIDTSGIYINILQTCHG